MEKTLVIIKPDAVQRGIIGEIVSRIERKGLQIVGMKMSHLSLEVLQQHYSHIKDKPFFPEVADFMASAPVVLVCVQGVAAVQTVRQMCGVTKAREATPGTIRGDLAMSVQANVVHASESLEAAVAEVARFFAESELHSYSQVSSPFIYSKHETN